MRVLKQKVVFLPNFPDVCYQSGFYESRAQSEQCQSDKYLI